MTKWNLLNEFIKETTNLGGKFNRENGKLIFITWKEYLQTDKKGTDNSVEKTDRGRDEVIHGGTSLNGQEAYKKC